MSGSQAPVRLCVQCGLRPVRPPSLRGYVYYYCSPCDNQRKQERIRQRKAALSPAQLEAARERERERARDYYARVRSRAAQRWDADAGQLVDRDTAEPQGEPVNEQTNEPSRALTSADSEQAMASVDADANIGRPPVRAGDAPGMLADVLLMVDRSRTAIQNGEIDGLRVAIDVSGVRVHFGTARIRESDGSNE